MTGAVGGAGQVARAGAPVTTVPLKEQLWNLYRQTGIEKPESREKFMAHLDEALEDGKITRKELRRLFGTSLTREAYLAFTGQDMSTGRGKEDSITPKELLQDMQHYAQFYKKTRIPLSYFGQCGNIIVISSKELARVFDAMTPAEMQSFVNIHQTQIKEYLNTIRYGTKKKQFGPEDRVDVDDITNLTNEEKEWLAFLLFYDVYKDVRKDKMRFNPDLDDSLVAKRFVATVYKDYLTAELDGIEKPDIRAIRRFSENIKKLKASLGDSSDIDLLGIDPSADEFDAFLAWFNDNPHADADEIRGKLDLLRRGGHAVPLATSAKKEPDPEPPLVPEVSFHYRGEDVRRSLTATV